MRLTSEHRRRTFASIAPLTTSNRNTVEATLQQGQSITVCPHCSNPLLISLPQTKQASEWKAAIALAVIICIAFAIFAGALDAIMEKPHRVDVQRAYSQPAER